MTPPTTWSELAAFVFHCLLFPALTILIYCTSIPPANVYANSTEYNLGVTILLTILRLLTVLTLPRLIITAGGLLSSVRCYAKQVMLQGPPLMSPFICFRVVTRGDYPAMVKQNLKTNMDTCFNVGLQNFIVEVVTDVPIHLSENNHVREVVVPANYRTKTGVLYKGRALQYCLEDGVNQLTDNDWIVHLDEETLLTENSVRGIINFVMDGQHQFGQGVVTYDNDTVNEFLTLMDAVRVAEDVGATRLLFQLFHKPLLGWRGSFCVCQVGPEKRVSFDHGPAASIAEDCVFALVAFQQGYTFNFVEGEMLEKSAFTLVDFLHQRKRWFEGKLLTAWDELIPFQYKLFVILDVVAWGLTPVLIAYGLLEASYPLPRWFWSDVMTILSASLFLYTYMVGVIKSHTLRHRKRWGRMALQLAVGGGLLLPFYSICYLVVVIWYLVGEKYSFHVIQKWENRICASLEGCKVI